MLFMKRWSRCAEITCDRAGLICCSDLAVAQMALAKLTTGGVDKLQGINLTEYINQISNVQSTPIRLLELFQTHPLIPKRIEALRLFAECDILHTWCPQLGREISRTKQEVDEQCEQFIGVLTKGYQPSDTTTSTPRTIQID